jgi:predicted DNA-binding protein
VSFRVSRTLARRLEREARRRGRTKSAVVREILEDALRSRGASSLPADEARRQSILVSTRSSERETLAFLERAKDTGGWE